jgi:hypothetical protein
MRRSRAAGRAEEDMIGEMIVFWRLAGGGLVGGERGKGEGMNRRWTADGKTEEEDVE